MSKTPAQRASYIARGLCSACGRQREDPAFRKCGSCRYDNTLYHARRRAAVARGEHHAIRRGTPSLRLAMLLEVRVAWRRVLASEDETFSDWLHRQIELEQRGSDGA